MASRTYQMAVVADEVSPRTRCSNYPKPIASQMAGRRKRLLDEPLGLTRARRLINDTEEKVVYLEVVDRTPRR